MAFPKAASNLHYIDSVPRIALLAAMLAIFAGCSPAQAPSAPPQPATASLVVNPPQFLLQPGASAQLSAQANDASGQPIGGAQFRFSAADSKVLQVSDRGLVTALGPAAARTLIIVASGRAEKRVPAEVRPGPPQVVVPLVDVAQTLTAGERPKLLSVRVQDAWGNPIPNQTITANATVATASLADSSTGADGQASFDIPPVTQVGDFAVTVHVRGSASPSLTFSFHVKAAPPAAIALAPDQTGLPGTTDSGATAALRVSDAYGNATPNIEVRSRLSKLRKELPPVRTDDNGIAVIQIPDASKARRVALEVELVDLPSIRASFIVSGQPR